MVSSGLCTGVRHLREIVESQHGPAIPRLSDRVRSILASKRDCLVGIICTYAFLRVLLFSAAFPLFNTLDEQDHFETVVRYVDGTAVQKELPQTSPELARMFALYGSPEYLIARSRLRAAGLDIPVARMREDLRIAQFEKRFGYWIAQRDMEAQSPPAYYVLASGWYRLGTMLGMKNWAQVYWVRGLNAIFYALFVWTAALCVRDVFAQDAFLGAAVPLLLAVWPQDVFFGVNREALSPLICALAWFALFRGVMPGKRRAWLFAGATLAGLAFLTDVSNFVVFGSLAAVMAFYAWRGAGSKSEKFAVVTLALLAAAVLPLGWMARNRAITGDLTGARAKVALLGWTVKPASEIWQHPIFSGRGAGYFGAELTERYWRGEYLWGGKPMTWWAADWFYLFSSLIFLGAALLCWMRTPAREGLLPAAFRVSCFVAIALSVLFLFAISLVYDFHDCTYPSRAVPYFVSGRILCGTLLPFSVIYLSGFAYLWRPFRHRVHPILPVFVLCVAITVIEVVLRATVFDSSFNFFAHLRTI